MFWKTFNPFLLDKGTNVSKITFVSNEKVILDVSNLRHFLTISKMQQRRYLLWLMLKSLRVLNLITQ